jgi:hypothetical protein
MMEAGASRGFEDIFSGLTQKSVKLSTYFAVYDEVLAKYRGKDALVLVEIGVMNGGSLVMWREYFGESARIIGVDFSPTAVAMREKGFEIFIGDQASPEFWRDFFGKVGDIDVLLDDGGHTNKHQITTIECCLDHIKDGGLILVEDVCTSYMPLYGNPSRYSFINYCKSLIDRIQGYPLHPRFVQAVHSIAFYSSIACLHVDRRLARKTETVTAGHEEIGALNYWNADKRLVDFDRGRRARAALKAFGPIIERAATFVYSRTNAMVMKAKIIAENRKLKRFF